MLTLWFRVWHTAGVPPATGRRQRNRIETLAALKSAARTHLGEHGAAALSVRAIARDLGMVSSAVYRYVRSRDELLTLLIVDAYDALGSAAEAAATESTGQAPATRWVSVGSAIRGWAREHPHEYALVYGSPVPGYAAPPDTVAPALRVTRALTGVVADAHAAGRLSTGSPEPLPTTLHGDFTAVAAALGVALPPEALARATIAWSQLFGLLSFELFGQTRHGFTDDGELFRAALASMAAYIGLPDD